MDKIKNISALLFTGGDHRPGSFAPAHAVLATSTLGHKTINHQIPYRPFRTFCVGFTTQKLLIHFNSLMSDEFSIYEKKVNTVIVGRTCDFSYLYSTSFPHYGRRCLRLVCRLNPGSNRPSAGCEDVPGPRTPAWARRGLPSRRLNSRRAR